MTALIVAVKGGYTHSVKEILKRNPNVNLTDKDGNTALMIASKEGHTDIVQDLLDAGTYVNIPDRVGAAGLSDAEGGGFTLTPFRAPSRSRAWFAGVAVRSSKSSLQREASVPSFQEKRLCCTY